MKFKLIFVLFIFLFIISLAISENITADTNIPADSSFSPIKKYFSKKKIIWTFDDYFIHLDHHPPHKGFYGLTEKITSYGGNVNIMVVLTIPWMMESFNNEIRNYSFSEEFGWSQEKIDKSLDFFNQQNVSAQCHGWNETSYMNTVSFNEAYNIICHVMWNWKNNYNIMPNFFIGHSTSGNYNTTLALKRFSENYWLVYGENFRWENPELFHNPSRDAPAVEYIGKADYVAMFDPLIGCSWGNPCETLEEAKELFSTLSEDKEIIFIRGHPDILNEENQENNLKLWEDWIDWIYQDHDLININHLDAIYYNVDREKFVLTKLSQDNFIIDLSNCQHNHNILFSQPYEDNSYNWTLTDDEGNILGEIYNDIFIELKSGEKYYFSTLENIKIPSPKDDDKEENVNGFEFLFLIFACLVLLFIKKSFNFN